MVRPEHLQATRFAQRCRATILRKGDEVLTAYAALKASAAEDGDRAEIQRQGALKAMLLHIGMVLRFNPPPADLADAPAAGTPLREIDEAALEALLRNARAQTDG